MTKLKFTLVAFMLTISGLFADSEESKKSAENSRAMADYLDR